MLRKIHTKWTMIMKINVLSLAAVFVLMTVIASCSIDDITQDITKKSIVKKENTRLTTFIADRSLNKTDTRTSLDHGSGYFFWENGDKVYVKDDDNIFQKSNNVVIDKTSLFNFMMPGTYTASKYIVYYPGKGGYGNRVTIAAEQIQETPYNSEHFGESGDCSVGLATKTRSGQFIFQLEHKAAYLCFLPYAKQKRVNTYITAIEVISDDNIAGTYMLSPTDEKLVGSGSGKTITLITKGVSDDEKGFPLKNTSPAIRENGAFMVIAPGRHKLTVKYHVKDRLTNVEGVIVKTLKAFDYKANNYYDIKSQLDVSANDAKARVPRIDIDIDGGAFVTDKKTYRNARFKISGMGIYPDITETVQIKGRGNSSWNDKNPYDKNPYRLKFKKAVTPFGLAKGKNWVLLSNKRRRSMLSNAIGMKLAALVQTTAVNHIIPVELYINGNYRGSYNFTEKVGISNNSVKVKDKSKAALLELDTYYDEQYKFYSTFYNLPVNVKDFHFAKDEIPNMLDIIRSDFDRFCLTLKVDGHISHLADVDQLARYLMVNELLCNYEIMHPKSTFLYKEDFTSANSKYIFGPVWDFDLAFGYETNRDYGTANPETDFWNVPSSLYKGQQFIRDLRFKDKAVDKAYYRVWTNFMRNQLQELLSFCDEYYRYVRPSFLNNDKKWNNKDDYQLVVQNMKTWLQRRANYIYARLTPYELEE